MSVTFIHSLINSLKAFVSMQRLLLYIHHSPKYKVKKIRDGVYLGCFKVFIVGNQDYEVSYRGLKFWTKADDESFEYFLKKIRDNEGMVKFEAKADRLFKNIKSETLEYMQVEGYGFDFFDIQKHLMSSNTDLFFIRSRKGTSQIIISRLDDTEVETFMGIQKLPIKERNAMIDEIVYDKGFSSAKFDPKATESLFGDEIPVSDRGLAPDYTKPGGEQYLYQQTKKSSVKITMSGNRAEDARRAFLEAGIDPDLVDPKLYTWHHLDDIIIDEDGVATCTMQLVARPFHEQVIKESLKGMIQPLEDILITGKHIGSVALWEALYGVSYK